MRIRDVGPGVSSAIGPTVIVDQALVSDLRARAWQERKTQRLLLHPGVEDGLHEMLIVHPGGIYIRPHLMAGTSKTYHVVEGRMTLVLFRDDGGVDRCIPLGSYEDGRTFVVRVMERRYHTLVIESEAVAFVETLPGPFRGTIYAGWAPDADGSEAAMAFGRDLTRVVARQGRDAS